MRDLRSALYALARWLGWWQAAKRGTGALARRATNVLMGRQLGRFWRRGS